MKRLLIPAMAAAALAVTGCQTAHIKTTSDGWEAAINSHWLKRDVDALSVTKTGPDSYAIELNGYKSDASEQLPAFTREMLAGLVALGQLIPMASKSAPAPAPALYAAPAASAEGQAALDPSCPNGNCTAAPAR